MVTASAFVLILSLTQAADGRAMPVVEIAKELTARTGVVHRVGNRLKDWPVFVRMASVDDARLKTLLATALRAEWVQEGKDQVLKPVSTFKPGAGLEAFRAGWPDTVKEHPVFAQLPGEQLYRMRVGDQILFSSEGEPNALAAKRGADGEPFRLIVRRLLGTTYELGQMSQPTVNMSYPKAIEALGDSVKEVIQVPKSLLPQPRMGGASLAFVDPKLGDGWTTMRLGETLLKAMAPKIKLDLVVAIPDAISTIGFWLAPSSSIGKLVSDLGTYLEWEVVDGALVGQMAAFDFGDATQADRQKAAAFLKEANVAFDTPILARYVSTQPPAANLAMNSFWPLFLAGKPMDPSVHFPYDLYLYQVLSANDWRILRSGEGTLADLSIPVQRAVNTLLWKSRMSLDGEGLTVATMPLTLVKVGLEEKEEEAVFFKYGDRSPELMDELNLASHRVWKGFEEAKATYMQARQRRLIVDISGVKVPFLKLDVKPGTPYVVYSKLPEDLRKRVDGLMEELRNQPEGEGGTSEPPPGAR